ncbi:MAG: hypothetical protein ACM3SM_07495 [Bacteroidota bacterium]
MRKFFVLISLMFLYFVCPFSLLTAQFQTYPGMNQGNLDGGLGITWINNQPYYSFHFRPEIAFSKIGVGLNLKLEFGADGKLRSENFNEFSDYLSIIRYVRYGQKQDPFYTRLGALDYATLGHGSIIYMYNNSPSFDTRKVGLELDLDLDRFGVETVYGNFGQAGVAGVRGYVRPFRFTDMSSVPLIRDIEVGASFAADFDKYAGVTSAVYNDSLKKLDILSDKGAMKVIGFDLGLPIRLSSIFTLTPYFDYSKIVEFGSGTALGLMFNMSGLGLVDVAAKLERRFNGDNYLPAYFNSFYEIDRFMADASKINAIDSTRFISKAARLESLKDQSNGYYGELLVRVLNTFDILGSYQRLDKDSKSGILHLVADISPKDGSYVARAGYDKVRIEGEKDLFTLDDRSYLYAEAGYKPMPYLLVSMVYHWTFSPVRDSDDKVIDYKPQKRIEPRVSFVYPFSVR